MRWKIHHRLCCFWSVGKYVPEWKEQRIRNWLRFRVWLTWRWWDSPNRVWRKEWPRRYNAWLDRIEREKRRELWEREIKELIQERAEARANRDFERSDRIRRILSDQYHYQVQDTKL